MSRFRIIDFFCGMGNFRAGFEKAGAICVYSVEWDEHKREIYKVIYGHEPDANDIRAIHAADIPEAECWCFGFPCVNASIAGDRAGLAGDGTGLFFEVMRLLKEKEEWERPGYIFAENVKGLLTVNRGWDFARILTEMDACGYDAEWQVIDSKYYLPQHRERLYIIGRLRRKCTEEILPIEIPVTEDEIQVRQLMEADSHRKNPNQYRVYDTTGVAPTLTKSEGGAENLT